MSFPLSPTKPSRQSLARSVFFAVAAALLFTACDPPPPNATFDYQIGGDYTPEAGVSVVSRDWFSGSPLAGEDDYSICYVNAFQTQADEPDTDRPDELSNWPANLVLTDLGDDPNWGGEYLIDISTAANRDQAAAWLTPMIQHCADDDFDAVEFDNLDSWTRFDETPLAGQVPFGQAEAVLFAEKITDIAHLRGLAVAQKNTAQLSAAESLDIIGFDFLVVEECGRYFECGDFAAVFGENIVAIEYTDAGFIEACNTIGADSAVVRRDNDVSMPGSGTYIFDSC